MRVLNEAGFAHNSKFKLDLIYNPLHSELPPHQEILEKEYRPKLSNTYGIEFDQLLTITNVPVNRYRDYLKTEGEYQAYFELLKNSFNPVTISKLMCRSLLSVGYDGKLYDCDFNLALGLYLKPIFYSGFLKAFDFQGISEMKNLLGTM